MEEIKTEVLKEATKSPKYNPSTMDLHLMIYEAVIKFKSVRRAQRRGHVTNYGTIAPNRPFNNRANTSTRKDTHSRVMNEYKKNIYGRIKSQEL